MTENDILIVAGAAGLAVMITLLDLLLSALRARQSARVRLNSNSPNRSLEAPQDEAAAARRAWIGQRLAAIQNASNDTPASPSVGSH